MPNIQIFDSGAFKITEGSAQIISAPGSDWTGLKPVRVDITHKGGSSCIFYQLDTGTVEVSITSSEFGIRIDTHLKLKEPCVWFHPIHEAQIDGFTGYFKQGLGMAGPSGFFPLDETIAADKPEQSFSLISLTADTEAALTIHAADHRRFMNQYRLTRKHGELESSIVLSAGFRLEGIDARDLKLPTLHISTAATLHEGLTNAASSIAGKMDARQKFPPTYHWCSWYYNYQNFDRKLLDSYLEGFKSIRPELPLQTIQIDAGYFSSLGDWLTPHERWPGGLKPAFEAICKAGFQPGIWIGPFMVGNRSQLAKDHPEWLLHNADGSLLVMKEMLAENKEWGYPDELTYSLDTSHPGAMDYILDVFRTLRKWGATFFKTDFIYWGMLNSVDVLRHSPGKTGYEYLSDFFTKVREAIGDDSYWLGCIAPFGPMIGQVDGMRLAGDVEVVWNEDSFGARNMVQECEAGAYFNNIFWQNDPDALFIRQFHTNLSPVERKSLALMQALTSGTVYTSDPLHELPEEDLALFRFVEPFGVSHPSAPLLTEPTPLVAICHELQGQDRFIIFLLNPTDGRVTERLSIRQLVGEEELHLTEWNRPDAWPADPIHEVVAQLESHESLLLFGARKSKPSATRENLWRLKE